MQTETTGSTEIMMLRCCFFTLTCLPFAQRTRQSQSFSTPMVEIRVLFFTISYMV
ncbi:hypothetical protein BDF19DRAFT_442090 [Syncephalis fuscata]|nr:hypothetical protein BDF19DRAFT_442090 [Syncephalis fuscata]